MHSLAIHDLLEKMKSWYWGAIEGNHNENAGLKS
jgi:hypothetical protein